MEGNIRKILTEYRDCTVQIVNVLQKDRLEALDELIEKRQQLVDEALNTTFIKEEAKLINEELQLQQLQDEMNELMLKKMNLIKNKIQQIAKSKTANNVYNRTGFISANIFSIKR